VPVGVSWAPFRSAKAAVKLHTLLDLRGNIPTFIHISDGKMHEVNILDQLLPEAGAFYLMDRGFLDFERLHRFHQAGSFFVTRGKSNLKAQRRYTHPVDRATGVICDQTVVLTGFYSRQGFDAPLRRIRFKDPETDKTLIFLTNNFALPALTVTALPLPLAGRTVLQMDQAASSDPSLLRYLGERGQVADLDCRVGVRPGRHRQEAAQPYRLTL